MKVIAVLLVFAVVLLSRSEALQMTKCQLVKELKQQGFPDNQLRDLVCLVEHESSFKTDVIGPPNTDGSSDHGLFQINDQYWCSTTNSPDKECHVTCAELRTDDITKASACAKIIYKVHGFEAWVGWVQHCKGQPLPSIDEC